MAVRPEPLDGGPGTGADGMAPPGPVADPRQHPRAGQDRPSAWPASQPGPPGQDRPSAWPASQPGPPGQDRPSAWSASQPGPPGQGLARPGWQPSGLWPEHEPVSPARKDARRWRGMYLLLLGLALAGLAAALTGVVVQLLPRTFSAAQKQQIMAWEMGKRWRQWPAGEIFPPTIHYQIPALALSGPTGLTLAARRMGIAGQAPCLAATDPAAAKVLLSHGCTAVLRATYIDATQSLAVTVGVAVLPSPAAARAALRGLPSTGGGRLAPGMRAVPFRHTLVTRFGDRQRQLSWNRAAGPYLVFATVGYADGRRRVNESSDLYASAEMVGVEDGVGGWVAARLGTVPPPPQCPGGPAC